MYRSRVPTCHVFARVPAIMKKVLPKSSLSSLGSNAEVRRKAEEDSNHLPNLFVPLRPPRSMTRCTTRSHTTGPEKIKVAFSAFTGETSHVNPLTTPPSRPNWQNSEKLGKVGRVGLGSSVTCAGRSHLGSQIRKGLERGTLFRDSIDWC